MFKFFRTAARIATKVFRNDAPEGQVWLFKALNRTGIDPRSQRLREMLEAHNARVEGVNFWGLFWLE